MGWLFRRKGMKICRQQETENYGAVSFITKTGREYAEKRTNGVLRRKEKQMNGKEIFSSQQQKNLDISFENFVEIYFADMENRLRESTIINKAYVFDLKSNSVFQTQENV